MMNLIYKNNIYKNITIITLVLILLVLSYTLYYINRVDHFSISLENQRVFYDDYRNYIEGKDFLLSKNKFMRGDGRLIPYTFDKQCFTKNFLVCKGNTIRDSLKCENYSYDQCV